ncbi:CD48 antigen-like [Hippopotamus amphibius kiboko]|uniref:CD48 antigen-like n=1 Tax=Hippopotamus amphibius kiboko TaxID=575201 RepID=UPI0025927168|nr:CD48 antigen-like [Hippopotamus amphibius kiboko]
MCSRRRELSLALGLLLQLHLFLTTSVQGNSKYAASGSNVSLQISSLPAKYKSLTWFYTADQKIVGWDSSKPKYFKTKFENRAKRDLPNGILHIHKVQEEDSGTYLLKVLKDTRDEEEERIQLVVLDPVPKPVINVTKIQDANNCYPILSCCYPILSCMIQEQSVNYSWCADFTLKLLHNSVLKVTHTPQNYSRSYTCQVSNPVSSQNDTVNFISACGLAPSSKVAWTTTWLVVMVTTVGLLYTLF